jgi:predicted DNA-binding protein
MPTKPNLTKPVSIRLSPKVREIVKRLSEDTGLLQAQTYEVILRAGCEAIEKNDMSYPMPLKFEIKHTHWK